MALLCSYQPGVVRQQHQHYTVHIQTAVLSFILLPISSFFLPLYSKRCSLSCQEYSSPHCFLKLCWKLLSCWDEQHYCYRIQDIFQKKMRLVLRFYNLRLRISLYIGYIYHMAIVLILKTHLISRNICCAQTWTFSKSKLLNSLLLRHNMCICLENLWQGSNFKISI